MRGILVAGARGVHHIIPGFEGLCETSLPLEHATLQALLVLDLEEAHDAFERDRTQPTFAAPRMHNLRPIASVSRCKHAHVVKLQSVFDHCSGSTTVNAELALGCVQGVEKRVRSDRDDVAVEERAGDLLVLVAVDLDLGLRSLREG